jgi:hypothetical protein
MVSDSVEQSVPELSPRRRLRDLSLRARRVAIEVTRRRSAIARRSSSPVSGISGDDRIFSSCDSLPYSAPVRWSRAISGPGRFHGKPAFARRRFAGRPVQLSSVLLLFSPLHHETNAATSVKVDESQPRLPRRMLRTYRALSAGRTLKTGCALSLLRVLQGPCVRSDRL